MALTHEEYSRMKEQFLDSYREDIKSMLQEKKKQHFEYSMERVTWKNFAQKHMAGFFFLLIIAAAAMLKDVVSIGTVAIFSLVQLFIFSYTYQGWEEDMRSAALNTFLSKTDSLVRDFIWQKMQEDTRNMSESEFEQTIQFYCIALYDIPNDVMFMYSVCQ